MKEISSSKQQQGLGLTEVLVAMLLLGIGVIGFAGLQVRAITATNDSSYRTQASAIARDVSERIRMNNTTNALNVYTSGTQWTTSLARNLCEGTTADASCSTDVGMANYDIADVLSVVASTLPRGKVRVATCQNTTNLCVYVAWNTTTPTVGTTAPDCFRAAGDYVPATPPNVTDCVISET